MLAATPAIAQNGTPGALKDFASKTLTTLKEHLSMVQKLKKP